MASATMSLLSVSFFSPFLPSTASSNGVRFSIPHKPIPSLKLSSSENIFGIRPLSSNAIFHRPTSRSLTIVAAKGYKMKTHKASAKRFRVTGTGKIVRRRAGKQHLLGKKNTKRKNRLSKMTAVDKSDYANVIGALPYLKVNRKAT